MSNQQTTQIGINKLNTQIENPTELAHSPENLTRETIPSGRKTGHPDVKTSENTDFQNRMVSNSMSLETDTLLSGKPFVSYVATPITPEPLENGNINRRAGFNYPRGNFSITPSIRDQPLLDDADAMKRMKMFEVSKQTETTKPVSGFRQFRDQRR